MIVWHIIAYVLIVIAEIAVMFFWDTINKAYEISSYCLLATNLACITILALILNTIVTKYLQTNPSSDSQSDNLAVTGSFLVQEE
jgi:hypothetical protein